MPEYLPLKEIDIVNNAINFSTNDLHVIGSCDIYTTKAAGDDKKLYKQIEDELESRHQSLLRLSASLSPPATHQKSKDKGKENEKDNIRGKRSRTVEIPEINLSRDSPFGSLSQISARRTFAYLIATLNAAHPDYDFSHVLRPKDFKKERSLRTLMNNVDSTMYNLRPNQNLAASYLALPSSHSSMVAMNNDFWSARMWDLLDQEMDLQKCEKYSYKPSDDPFEAEGSALWSMHYFFFNKERKRVCYFYLRALSVMSHSPIFSQPSYRRKKGVAVGEGAGKRASYWLGEAAEDADSYGYGDDDDEMEAYYPESSDDEDVDRLRYSDLDQIRNNISAGHWGCGYDGASDSPVRRPESVTDEIGESMDI